jgi:hypothetical protein
MRTVLNNLLITGCCALVLGTAGLQAAPHRTGPVEIPFAFKVYNRVLPAGTYRIQRGDTQAYAELVNIKTGQRVQLLRSFTSESTKTKLIFEREGTGFVLRKLS